MACGGWLSGMDGSFDVGPALATVGRGGITGVSQQFPWRGKCPKSPAGSTPNPRAEVAGGIRLSRIPANGAAVEQFDRIIADLPEDRPVLIAGPTASGKSALAAQLVARHGGLIVNADALQVYADWRVLTARPTVTEQAALPHALYGHVARDQPYSVGHWLRELAPLLAGPLRPVIVGGTGLYFTALTTGLARIPPVPAAVRAEGEALLATRGLDALQSDLDPETAARIDTGNPARVQRAWEVWRATGRGLAAWQADTAPPLLPLSQTAAIVLRPDRDWLSRRIEVRFDAMLAAGALQEVRAALPHWTPGAPWARAIGAAELVAHLRGEMALGQAREAACTATRRYAKRQRTWFRNQMQGWQALTLP
jgi:tRNA dimethylallyltransferase